LPSFVFLLFLPTTLHEIILGLREREDLPRREDGDTTARSASANLNASDVHTVFRKPEHDGGHCGAKLAGDQP
jgi:hypothetical protein